MSLDLDCGYFWFSELVGCCGLRPGSANWSKQCSVISQKFFCVKGHRASLWSDPATKGLQRPDWSVTLELTLRVIVVLEQSPLKSLTLGWLS